MELQYGCRSEYGPLELRIQAEVSANGFIIFVEDHRAAAPVVFEHAAQGTLESAKEVAPLRADEYLRSRHEEAPHAVEWRCA